MRSDGSAWIIGWLSASLLLVAVLAWQAFDAALSHRTAAESVLRDYARLAADEFVRRTTSEVGYYGYYRLGNAVAQYHAEHPDGVPDREALLEADPKNERALSLVRYFFRLDRESRDLETSGASPAEAVRYWLSHELEISSAENPQRSFLVENVQIAGQSHSFVYASVPDTSVVLGIEVELDSLKDWFGEALSRQPLLPPSLGKGVDDLDFLGLTVQDANGRERFRAGRSAGTLYPLSASVPYGDAYEGIFDGLTARVTLHPEAAAKLVIGGLPGSRLPALFGLIVLTVGLLLAAIFQLRRERSLTRLRSDFVSQVSHELRTPLTQIRMFAETLLLGRVRSEEEGRRSLEIVDQEARRLSHLVENILQFSRSERGTVRLAPEPRELAPLVRDLVRGFEPLVGRRDVAFALHPAEEATALVDEDALRQILLNLLDNAVKYGPSKQQIVIGLERAERWARLSVDDEGPGIPARERRRIWRSYERLERDRRSAVAGTGIGLAVVRELVALQGGRIHVERGERDGARFVIELPLAESETMLAAKTVEEAPA